MPRIPLYNQGQGSTTQLATGQLSPRASISAFTAPSTAKSNFFNNASKVAAEFGLREKARETDRIYAEQLLEIQKQATTFNLENKDTTIADYQGSWKTFQSGAENRINGLSITKSQKADILARLAPDFAKQNIAGQQNAHNRGTAIASSAFQAVTNNDIETIASLPLGHPDRVGKRNGISTRSEKAMVDGLNIGDYSPQFVDNQIEKLTVTKKIDSATSLGELSGTDNLIKQFKNLSSGDIKALNADINTAKVRIRADSIGSLTATLNLDDVGTKVTDISQIDEKKEKLLSGDIFKERPALKKIFDDLDDVGKQQFIEQVRKKSKNMADELRLRQGQDDRRIKDNNEELFTDISDRIRKFNADTPSVAEINSATFEGADGEKLREGLLGLLQRRLEVEFVTDTSPKTYNAIKKSIHTDKITSITQPFTLPHEKGKEGFANTASFEEGKSIIDRGGETDGLSQSDYDELSELVLGREKANKTEEAQLNKDAMDALQAFLEANESRIMGYKGLKALDLSSDQRFYDFSIFMQKRFKKQISEGKDYNDLLNPRSPDYILKEPDKFALSFQEQIKLVGEQMRQDQPELSEISPPKKLAGETVAQYEARTKEYYDSQDWQLYQSLLAQETQ